jgi:hypothetical protein
VNRFQATIALTLVAEWSGFSAVVCKIVARASAANKMLGRMKDALGVKLLNLARWTRALTDQGH